MGPALSRRIDWSTLRSLPARFVEPPLTEQRSDVLFSAQWRAGRPLLVYVLFEHQSTVDAWMPLRLLGYMLAIWKRHLDQHPDCTRLPLILPLVLHHSEGGWTAAVRFRDIVDADAELLEAAAEHLPDFRFVLDDLSRTRDDELRGRSGLTALAQLALVCLGRARRDTSFMGELRRWRDMALAVLASPTGLPAFEALLRYTMEASDTARDELEAFAHELGSRAEEAFMSAAQILRAEGRADVLLKQLKTKFGPIGEELDHRVRTASLEEIDLWAERVLTAETIAEVFADS